jgi:hypothetical protein
MKQPNFPRGWDEERVRRLLEHYNKQSDQEAVAEDEAAHESTTHTSMEIPVDLVPQVRELLAKRHAGWNLGRTRLIFPARFISQLVAASICRRGPGGRDLGRQPDGGTNGGAA